MSMLLPHLETVRTYASGIRPPSEAEAIRLHLNESPYPPSPRVLELLCSLDDKRLRQYPDAWCDELREELAFRNGIGKEHILVGNGSSELILMLYMAALGPGRRVAMPDPTFQLYASFAALFQAECRMVPTGGQYEVDVDGLLEAKGDVTVLVNPNAPTGVQLPLAEVERLVSRSQGLVVVDEAYLDFADGGLGSSAISLLSRYPQLLVVRTFSKAYALCGARVGYCMGSEELIAQLFKCKPHYNVSASSQLAALAALRDDEYLRRTVTAVKSTRDSFSQELVKMGFGVVPSQTNFVLCMPPGIGERTHAAGWAASLQEKHIYVRHYPEPGLDDKLRISIGTEEQMAACGEALKVLMARRLF